MHFILYKMFRGRSAALSRMSLCLSTRFVPEHEPPNAADLERLKDYVYAAKRLLVMTGAGVSTESGIPDYRSEKVGRYARTDHRPVQYDDFMRNERTRQRYWARNYVAWPMFSSLKPNLTHLTLADWEAKQRIHWLITQNVDYLHRKAGSKNLTELHGNAYSVRCTDCAQRCSRDEFQTYIKQLNANWTAEGAEVAPDGDVDLSDDAETTFKTPTCPRCNGIMKPEIIFFGETLSVDSASICYDRAEEADAIMVLGSSLQVLSGLRYVYQIWEHCKPVLIVNIGPTRADELATVKLSSKCSDVIKTLNDDWPQ